MKESNFGTYLLEQMAHRTLLAVGQQEEHNQVVEEVEESDGCHHQDAPPQKREWRNENGTFSIIRFTLL